MSEHLPAALISSLQSAPGFNESDFIRTHESGEQVISVRINPAKIKSPDLIKQITNHATIEDAVPWSSTGLYLDKRPSFTLDPTFHAGAYYVQEASSMFLEEALKQTSDLSKPMKVLDLCAAPGGKSTLIASIISSDSLLVSNEIIKARANILSENITKWGSDNVVVTNNEPRDFQKLKGFFDVIVVDAPCSGSGLFRKDPTAVSEWSLNSVELCRQRQQKILAEVLPSLKQDGILIYSTCSYSQKEDEEICDWLLQNDELKVETVPLRVNPAWRIIETISVAGKGYGYRFYPDKLRGEGFFIAAFRKLADEKAVIDNSRKVKPVLATKDELLVLGRYIKNIDRYSFLKLDSELLAIPKTILPAVLLLRDTLYIRKAGVKAGILIRDELLPDHQLVLSNILLPVFPVIEVDEATALDYLRRKEITIPSTFNGWAIISYLGFALGLVKILSNRINNYYPKEWRIINK